MNLEHFENSGGNVIISDNKYIHDEHKDIIYKLHTHKTDGKPGSISDVICPQCKNSMMKAKEYYCPVCENHD